MSSRTWIVGIALGLAFAVSALAQEPEDPADKGEPVAEPRQEQETPTSQDNGAQRTAPDITAILQGIEAAIRDLISEEDQGQRERQEQREITDLQAQQDMALWAKAMFLAALAGLGLTFAGLVLIGFTLHHTRRAANYAKDMVAQATDATRAAEAAVTVTREVAERELRAYLSVDQIAAQLVRGVHGYTLSTEIVVKNGGQTPAEFLGMAVNVALHGKNGATGRIEPGRREIGPGGIYVFPLETHFTDKVLARGDADGKAGGGVLILTIRYRYLDYLEREWGRDVEYRSAFDIQLGQIRSMDVVFSAAGDVEPENGWREM